MAHIDSLKLNLIKKFLFSLNKWAFRVDTFPSGWLMKSWLWCLHKQLQFIHVLLPESRQFPLTKHLTSGKLSLTLSEGTYSCCLQGAWRGHRVQVMLAYKWHIECWNSMTSKGYCSDWVGLCLMYSGMNICHQLSWRIFSLALWKGQGYKGKPGFITRCFVQSSHPMCPPTS